MAARGRICLLAALQALLPARHAAATVPIATFDGAGVTTRSWEVVDDPVMGGQSKSAFKVDSAHRLGIWSGEVKIVPFLHAPGFCTLQSPGLRKMADFPDLSGTDGLAARMRQTLPSGLAGFSVQVRSKASPSPELVYTANFTAVGPNMSEHFLPWSAFVCTHRGQPSDQCPALSTQTGNIGTVGFSTVFPGSPGAFNVEIESLFARGPQTAKVAPISNTIELASFGDRPTHSWKTENDPVMGGQSSSTFAMEHGFGDYQGSCRIVPKLQAPGFTIVLTETPLFSRFPDISSMDGLLLNVRSVGGNVTGFKVAFCDSRIPFLCQFKSFKADFEAPAGPDFGGVFVPWAAFSNAWSPSTGKHTAENPPAASSLRSVTQLQIWTEGVLGDFHLQIQSVAAAKAPEELIVI